MISAAASYGKLIKYYEFYRMLVENELKTRRPEKTKYSPTWLYNLIVVRTNCDCGHERQVWPC